MCLWVRVPITALTLWWHYTSQYICRHLENKMHSVSTFFWSATVAYPLRGSTRCVFRDALLHTTVVIVSLWPSCHLQPVLLLWPLSLTRRFCPENSCSLDVCCFFLHHSLQTLVTVVCENVRPHGFFQLYLRPFATRCPHLYLCFLFFL